MSRMEALGFKLREKAVLETPTPNVVKASEIEGEKLNTQQVRASRVPRLGSDFGQALPDSKPK